MKHTSLFHRIQQEKAPETLFLVVEISQGDYNKYEYNHELDVLEVDRVLYGPMFYPVNYCDVPGTWNEHDKDPLDAILFSSKPIVSGAMVTGRVIGAMEMIDNGEITGDVNGDGKIDNGEVQGDANGNGQIQNNDSENFWKSQYGMFGYYSGDFNLNTQVQNNDRETYWRSNYGKGSQVPN